MSRSRFSQQAAEFDFDHWLGFFNGQGECDELVVRFAKLVAYAEDIQKTNKASREHVKKANDFLVAARDFLHTKNLSEKIYSLEEFDAYYLLHTGESANNHQHDKTSIRIIIQMGHYPEFLRRLDHGFPHGAINSESYFGIDGLEQHHSLDAPHLKELATTVYAERQNESPQIPSVNQEKKVDSTKVGDYVDFYRDTYPRLSRQSKKRHNEIIAETISVHERDNLFRIAEEKKPKSPSLWGRFKEKCKQVKELSGWKQALIMAGIVLGGVLIAVGTGGIALPAVIAGWATVGVGLATVTVGTVVGVGIAASSLVALAVSGDSKVYDPISLSETKDRAPLLAEEPRQDEVGSQDTRGIHKGLGLSVEPQVAEDEPEHGISQSPPENGVSNAHPVEESREAEEEKFLLQPQKNGVARGTF